MKCDILLNLFPWHLSLKYLILINRQMVFRTGMRFTPGVINQDTMKHDGKFMFVGTEPAKLTCYIDFTNRK
jgi:hypothetical protein